MSMGTAPYRDGCSEGAERGGDPSTSSVSHKGPGAFLQKESDATWKRRAQSAESWRAVLGGHSAQAVLSIQITQTESVSNVLSRRSRGWKLGSGFQTWPFGEAVFQACRGHLPAGPRAVGSSLSPLCFYRTSL